MTNDATILEKSEYIIQSQYHLIMKGYLLWTNWVSLHLQKAQAGHKNTTAFKLRWSLINIRALNANPNSKPGLRHASNTRHPQDGQLSHPELEHHLFPIEGNIICDVTGTTLVFLES